ncbi:hypothetical protein GCM10011375_16600 [Hymenobacter qilianensis]|uniref:Uncharacterized protein n=1 Tax=Hymenobacter qilianensis TaxID=1385715 RepID=A0ACB5PQR1_9BACT|nr:hypothetical protein GCM10011375_16600 [Hymenobacter qilianensis]
MQMTAKQRTALRQQLLAECRRAQQQKADTARKAMLLVEESAHETQGAIEDKFESFREACHIQRDLFARQLDEALTGLQVLQRVSDVRPSTDKPSLGSVVVTDSQTFFIALSLGEIKVEGQPYCVISAFSPIYQAMTSARPGDAFTFRGKSYQVQAVY